MRLVSSSLVDGDPVILGAYPVYYLTSRVLTVASFYPFFIHTTNPPPQLPPLLPTSPSPPIQSLPQLPQTNLLIIMLIQHLGRRQIEIFLRHMHPPLSQCIHARLRAYALQLRAAAPIHLLRNLGEVDAAGQVHAARVDA